MKRSANKSNMQKRLSPYGVVACLLLTALPPMLSEATVARQQQPIKPTIPTANRYESGKVFLEHADHLSMDENVSKDYQVLVGNVKFRKGDMFMYCDSAHFYMTTNSLDAYSNVKMEQGDTLFVYADELNYDGPREMATLYGSAGQKVRLINRDVKLETDVFYYDLAVSKGFYNVGGILTDRQNSLRSWRGEYYPNTKNADFYDDVVLKSNRPADTLRMYTDELHYNTATHIARIEMPTRIINKDGKILTSSGTYNTNNGQADLFSRSTVYTNNGATLTGDTLFYDRTKGYGEAYGNMVLVDSIRYSTLSGDYGFYNEIADSAFVTGRALAKEYKNGDTLYLHGDTINAYLVKADSTRITNAFHKVRFYRSDIQGICDSLSGVERDSIMYMFGHPVVWSGERQIFGNLIHVHANDSMPDWARLPEFGFMAEHILEDCYNQLCGNEMKAWFNDSTITRLYVEGNVQLITFPMESDSSYNKYGYAQSSFLDVTFKGNTIERGVMWPEAKGNLIPLFSAKKGSYFLPKFKWLDALRPKNQADIFIYPSESESLLQEIENTSGRRGHKSSPNKDKQTKLTIPPGK